MIAAVFNASFWKWSRHTNFLESLLSTRTYSAFPQNFQTWEFVKYSSALHLLPIASNYFKPLNFLLCSPHKNLCLTMSPALMESIFFPSSFRPIPGPSVRQSVASIIFEPMEWISFKFWLLLPLVHGPGLCLIV